MYIQSHLLDLRPELLLHSAGPLPLLGEGDLQLLDHLQGVKEVQEAEEIGMFKSKYS